MKKFLPYFLFSTIALIFAVALSFVLKFSLSNSWQAGIVMLFVFGPYWVYGWKQTAANKEHHPLVYLFSRFCLIVTLLGYFISVLAFMLTGW